MEPTVKRHEMTRRVGYHPYGTPSVARRGGLVFTHANPVQTENRRYRP